MGNRLFLEEDFTIGIAALMLPILYTTCMELYIYCRKGTIFFYQNAFYNKKKLNFGD